MKILDGQVLHL